MSFLAHTCSIVRERVLVGLFVGMAIISSVSVASHYSLATVDSPQAQLYLTPSIETVSGATFTTEVIIESPQPTNVFAGKIIYDPDLISVIEIDYEQSIADLWVQVPEFAMVPGEISFSGGRTSSDGFVGTGSVFSVTFQAIAVGSTTLHLSERTVLKHDGNGTEISLKTASDPTISITAPSVDRSRLTTKLDLQSNQVTDLAADQPDLNGDGQYTFNDVGIYMEYVRTNDSRADLNHDGQIDDVDWQILTTP